MAQPHPFDALPRHLWKASAEAAREALRHYASAEQRVQLRTAISLGTAAEHLLMACVAHMDPALLADRNSASSQVAFSRANTSGTFDIHLVKTITPGAALNLIEQHRSALGITADVTFVMQTRNSAAHLAMTDTEDIVEAVIRLSRIVAKLHTVLSDFDEADYWGARLEPFVTKLRDDRATSTQRSYTAKRLAAEAHYEELVGGLDDEQRTTIIRTMEGRAPSEYAEHTEGVSYQQIECPACHNTGYQHYSTDRLEDYKTEVDYDRDGNAENAYVTVSVLWSPLAFECPVCDLRLSPSEAAITPGIESFIDKDSETLTDQEFAEYMSDYEPEFDR